MNLDPYRIAMMVVRLAAAMNLACGLVLCIFSVLGLAVAGSMGAIELAPWLLTPGLYGIVYVSSGLSMWIFARSIVRFAIKSIGSIEMPSAT